MPLESAATLIDKKIEELGDWRGKTLAKLRALIQEADPAIVDLIRAAVALNLESKSKPKSPRVR